MCHCLPLLVFLVLAFFFCFFFFVFFFCFFFVLCCGRVWTFTASVADHYLFIVLACSIWVVNVVSIKAYIFFLLWSVRISSN